MMTNEQPHFAIAKPFVIVGVSALLLFTVVNAIVVQWIGAFSTSGEVFPMIYRGDLFADFFKIPFSLPAGKEAVIDATLPYSDLLVRYKLNPVYGGLEALNSGGISHFGFPLPTLFMSMLAYGLTVISSQKLFVLTFALAISMGALTITRSSVQSFAVKYLAFLCVASYPFVLILQRGQILSLLTVIALTVFFISVFRRHRVFLGVVALAAAINVRPYLATFAILLLTLPIRSMIQSVVALGVAVCIIFFSSMMVIDHIYPEYSFGAVLRGLENYHALYIVGDAGAAYSVSLHSFTKIILALLGDGWLLPGATQYLLQSVEKIGFAISIFVPVIGLFHYRRRRIGYADLLICTAISSMLGTPSFADYHLLVFAGCFLVIVLELFCDSDIVKSKTPLLTAIILAFLLSPKNYLAVSGVLPVHALVTIAGVAVLGATLQIGLISARLSSIESMLVRGVGSRLRNWDRSAVVG